MPGVKRINQEDNMDGVLFLVFWLGSALLHTLYDLKIAPLIREYQDDGSGSSLRR